jgi:GT2 family glycosyltransferase
VEYTGVDVVIPAHDEQDLLAGCLDALEDCIAATPVPVTVTVVLDSCRDATEEIARGRARLVRTSARNVGIARARGFDSLRRPSSSSPGSVPSPSRRWYATTDADSRVPRTWLTDQLAVARSGADVVAGLIAVDDWSDWTPATRLSYLEGYHPGPGHRHIHGADIGISARAYRQLGGFDPLPVHEDVQLVRRAQEAGRTVAWSTAAPVMTSARRTARAPGGFAGHLAATECAATARAANERTASAGTTAS